MSIDLYCYTSFSECKAQNLLDEFIKENFDQINGFYKFYHVSKVYDRNELLNVQDKNERYHLESTLMIAEEHNFSLARSSFLIGVLDKSFSGVGLSHFVNMIKEKFSENSILILHNFDTVM